MLDSLIVGLAETTPDIFDAVLAPLGGFLSRPMRGIRVPDEPTALALAFVCLGSIGAYVAVTRYLRPGRVEPPQIGRFSDQVKTKKLTSEPRQVPRRGAA